MPGGLPGGGGMLKLRFDRYISRCEIYDYAMVLIWKFAWDMPMNDKKRKRVSRY